MNIYSFGFRNRLLCVSLLPGCCYSHRYSINALKDCKINKTKYPKLFNKKTKTKKTNICWSKSSIWISMTGLYCNNEWKYLYQGSVKTRCCRKVLGTAVRRDRWPKLVSGLPTVWDRRCSESFGKLAPFSSPAVPQLPPSAPFSVAQCGGTQRSHSTAQRHLCAQKTRSRCPQFNTQLKYYTY